MTLGSWLYYRRKYKLIVNNLRFKTKNKTILALTYDRSWELPAGWEVKYFDLNSSLTFINAPDIVIEREFNDGKSEYEFLYSHNLKNVPKIFWFIDAHVSDEKRIRYCDNFDFTFVAHSPFIENVKKITTCKNIFWLPLCYPSGAFSVTENLFSVKYPVSFIGRFGEGFARRNEMIDFLKKQYKENFFAATDYTNPQKLICESKVTTNHSMMNDLNFRVFEALGLGTELVTNHVPDLDKIEGLKSRLNPFSDFHELKNIIDAVLNDVHEKKHDMKNVQEWIHQNHTYKQRLAEMLRMIDTGKQVEYK